MLKSKPRTEALGSILQLLVQRRLVQVLADGKLPVDTLLRDVEVLYIEEPVLAHSLDEALRELLLALWRAVEAEVDGDKVSPIEVLLFI